MIAQRIAMVELALREHQAVPSAVLPCPPPPVQSVCRRSSQAIPARAPGHPDDNSCTPLIWNSLISSWSLLIFGLGDGILHGLGKLSTTSDHARLMSEGRQRWS